MFYIIDAHREDILKFMKIKKGKEKEKFITCEIGVKYGNFSEEIIKKLNPDIHYMIDPYCYHEDILYKADPANQSQEIQNIIYKNVLKKFKYGLNKQTLFINRKSSTSAAEDYPDDFFDFIYRCKTL